MFDTSLGREHSSFLYPGLSDITGQAQTCGAVYKALKLDAAMPK